MKRQKGFTLIELLVVIAIIGILASVTLASLNDARATARDAKRQTDLKAIQTALELYHLKFKEYPHGTDALTALWGGVGAGSDRACWILQDPSDLDCHPLGALTAAGVMPFVPYDPGINTYLGTGCGGAQFYAYWSDGKSYLLGAVRETQGSEGCFNFGNWSGPNNNAYTYQYYLRDGF